MENSIAVISVPLNEWVELKEQLKAISKGLLDLKGRDKPEYLTPKECCELLKCSRNTFQSYIDMGILDPIKMKSQKYSKVLVKRVDIEHFIESKL